MKALKDSLLILGGGGHSLVVQEALVGQMEISCLGIVDQPSSTRPSPFQIPRVGQDEDLEALFAQGWSQAVVAVGSLGDTSLRRKLRDMLAEIGFAFPCIIDSSAMISAGATISGGAFVAKGAIVQPGAFIGEMAILNTGSIVEHGCQVGAFSHVSSGAVLLGDVTVGQDTFIGGGSVVRQGIRIGSHCVIGAGSVVVKDIPDGSVAYGNPCRVRRTT